MSERWCSCGVKRPATKKWQESHERSRWHKQAPDALRMKNLGLTYAEIGRQLGLTRAYVRNRLRAVKRAA